MIFRKKFTLDGETTGDFDSFNHDVLLQELQSSLGGDFLGMSTTSRRIIVDGDESRREDVLAIIQAHDAVRDWEAYEVKEYTPDQFRDKFSDAEQLAILKASDTDDNLRLLMHKLYTTPRLVSTSVDFIAGVSYLVAQGLCAQELADDILGN